MSDETRRRYFADETPASRAAEGAGKGGGSALVSARQRAPSWRRPRRSPCPAWAGCGRPIRCAIAGAGTGAAAGTVWRDGGATMPQGSRGRLREGRSRRRRGGCQRGGARRGARSLSSNARCRPTAGRQIFARRLRATQGDARQRTVGFTSLAHVAKAIHKSVPPRTRRPACDAIRRGAQTKTVQPPRVMRSLTRHATSSNRSAEERQRARGRDVR